MGTKVIIKGYMSKGEMDKIAKKPGTVKSNSPLQISGRLLARNTLLNFFGQSVPLGIGLVTIPFIVQGLGTERFGLLSLAWVILGYFAIFDLGLGRATTKFVAEALGRGEEGKIPHLVWTAVTVQALFGILGAIVLVSITPLLVERILNIPAGLWGEARATFYVLALSIPVVLVSSSFSGVLQAAQRFDLVNAVRTPSSVLTFLIPLVGLWVGLDLPGIVFFILLARIGSLVVFIVLNSRIIPQLRSYSASFSLFPHLFSFGGWVMVSSIINPILVYFDRFLIASLLSLTAVAYYTAPYAVVIRLLIIPGSLVMSLFPAFSALMGIKERQKLGILFARSIKYELLTIGAIVLIFVLFAEDMLHLWLGRDFAIQSKTAMQILVLGVLVNSLAHVPSALLQGVGRPDITAKFHLFELPIYIGLAWLLVSQWGIAGAAAAWTFRVALDAFLLFVAAFRVCRLPLKIFSNNGLTVSSFALLMLAGVTYGLKILTDKLPLFVQAVILVILFGIFAWVFWCNILDTLDRDLVLKMVKL